MKTLLIALLSMTSTIMVAQNTVTWEGGTPGKENRWDEARNWSNNQVPDENSYVIINHSNSGHHAQPVIENNVEVASIEIRSGSLSITTSGKITIDGENAYTSGITILNGHLVNDGVVEMKNIDSMNSRYFINGLKGNGLTFVEGKSLHNFQIAQF